MDTVLKGLVQSNGEKVGDRRSTRYMFNIDQFNLIKSFLENQYVLSLEQVDENSTNINFLDKPAQNPVRAGRGAARSSEKVVVKPKELPQDIPINVLKIIRKVSSILNMPFEYDPSPESVVRKNITNIRFIFGKTNSKICFQTYNGIKFQFERGEKGYDIFLNSPSRYFSELERIIVQWAEYEKESIDFSSSIDEKIKKGIPKMIKDHEKKHKRLLGTLPTKQSDLSINLAKLAQLKTEKRIFESIANQASNVNLDAIKTFTHENVEKVEIDDDIIFYTKEIRGTPWAISFFKQNATALKKTDHPNLFNNVLMPKEFTEVFLESFFEANFTDYVDSFITLIERD